MSGVATGLTEAHIAKQTNDIEGAVTYDAPKRLYDVQQVQVNPEVQTENVPGDDGIAETITQCLGGTVSVQWAKQNSSEKSNLLGEKKLPNGIKISGETDDAPYFAFGYKRTMTGGVIRYVWLLKVKFGQTQETADTKNPKNIQPQYPTVSGTASTRKADKQWKFYIDSDDPDFTTEVGNNWFTKATLETLANAVNQVYGQPATVTAIDALPTTGIPGVIYHLTTDDTHHYWDGSKFVEI